MYNILYKKIGTLLASLWLLGVPSGVSALAPVHALDLETSNESVLAPSPILQAVGIITGRVLGPSGQPLASVQVFLPDLNLGALTQANGRYLIQNAPAGTYTLTAARIGYRANTVQIMVLNDQT